LWEVKIMKVLRVNMGDKTIGFEDVPAEYAGLGGRGLTSIMINAEVPPLCDPLVPENKLIFAPGLLSGTPPKDDALKEAACILQPLSGG
jgi:aldehyde:ferredoxin oxidoreductase